MSSHLSQIQHFALRVHPNEAVVPGRVGANVGTAFIMGIDALVTISIVHIATMTCIAVSVGVVLEVVEGC